MEGGQKSVLAVFLFILLGLISEGRHLNLNCADFRYEGEPLHVRWLQRLQIEKE
jgi:hypothetical protein